MFLEFVRAKVSDLIACVYVLVYLVGLFKCVLG